MVELLIGGACPNTRNATNCTRLHRAAALGHDKLVSTLLGTARTNKDALDNGGASPLILASEKGHVPTVQALLASGADLSIRDLVEKGPPLLGARFGLSEGTRRGDQSFVGACSRRDN